MEAFDPQAFDVFKMPTIIGKESQIVPQRGSGDQEIQIADELTLLPQRSANLSEPLTSFLVDSNDADVLDELAQHRLASAPIAGEDDPLPQFGHRNNVNGDSLWFKFSQPFGGGAQAVQVIDDPVGVNQERDAGHKRGSGRVINERLS